MSSDDDFLADFDPLTAMLGAGRPKAPVQAANGLQVKFEPPHYIELCQRHGLINEPWAHCMFNYAMCLTAAMETGNIVYIGEQTQPLDPLNLAKSNCFLYGLEPEQCFSRKQWAHIDKIMHKLRVKLVPPDNTHRHWGSDTPALILLGDHVEDGTK